MNTPKTLINQLISEYEYKLMVRKCRRQAILNNKPIYKPSQLFTGSIVKLEQSSNGSIAEIPAQNFAIFTSTPYYVNFATNLELEPNYNDQIGSYVINNLTPLEQSCPYIVEKYSLDDESRLSKYEIIELEKEIIERFYPNQNQIDCEF